MQTFLPMGDSLLPYYLSASSLDRLRLNKQRVECKQILEALTTGKGWIHHPATKMWSGYEYALCAYGIAICDEWLYRGYKDSLLNYFFDNAKKYNGPLYPPWISNIAKSHRAALLAKNYDWYSQFDWVEEPEINYWWPTKNGF